jgi:hypothetical protein
VSTWDFIPAPPEREVALPKAVKYEAIPDPDVGAEVAPDDTLSKYVLTAGADGAAVAPDDMASKYDFTADAEPWIEEVLPIVDK